MKTPRLIPVVIAATAALLLLKGIGLVTSGGYVLIGTGTAVAAGGGGHAAPAAADQAAGATMTLPGEVTMADTNPTLQDGAATLPLGPDAAHGAAGNSGHGAPADQGHDASAEATAGHGEGPAAVATVECPPTATAAGEAIDAHGAPVDAHNKTDDLPGFDFTRPPTSKCKPDPGVNEHGDALPLIENGAGDLEPLGSTAGSEQQVLARLGERREDLDSREKELEMRLALVEAAEKRLDERTAALKALEAQINALVDERKSAEKEQFVGIVAMYETMKPKEAATIFNELDPPVLLKVARAMNPRKMAPILARMDPVRAMQLTAGLAEVEADPTGGEGAEDLASLPQIVGQ